MDKYIELAVEMYFKGCTVRQAIGIAADTKKGDEKSGKGNNFGNYR